MRHLKLTAVMTKYYSNIINKSKDHTFLNQANLMELHILNSSTLLEIIHFRVKISENGK